MKEIIWNADDCVIPKYGAARKGQPKFLPDELAEHFIATGQAKEPGPVIIGNNEEESE